MLTVYFVRSGSYAVFPRTESLEQVQAEHDAQMTGHTADRNVIGVGQGENPELVLSVVARRVGTRNMFNASITDMETSIQIAGHSEGYLDLNDGIRAMETLAATLTGTLDQLLGRQRKELARAKFWSIGAFVGTTFADPMLVTTLRGTISPFRHGFFDIGIDAGFISRTEWDSYYSLYPFIHYNYYLPFGKSGWYIGAGFGYMMNNYTIDDLAVSDSFFAMDIGTGFILFNFLDISYTLRTNFTSVSNKLSLGFVYRFK